jgi:hypothetical protein
MNLAMALSVEVAEIIEHFQWLTEEQSRNLPPEKLAEVREEIGDVMIYLTEHTMDTYSHVSPNIQKEAFGRLGNRLEGL